MRINLFVNFITLETFGKYFEKMPTVKAGDKIAVEVVTSSLIYGFAARAPIGLRMTSS